MHGFSSDENEGYVMFFNPKLEALPLQHSPMIQVVDVAATLAKFLQGVDIPFNSVGIPQNYFGEDAIVSQCKILMQSAHQLKRLAEYEGKLDDDLRDQVDRLLNGVYPKRSDQEAMNNFYHNLHSVTKQLQYILYDTMTPPYQSFGISVTILLVILLSLWWVLRFPVTLFSTKSIVFLLPLAVPLVHLLFGVDFYQIVFNRGSIFFLPSAMLSIWIVYQTISMLIQTETTKIERNLVQSIASLTILNESINWTALALSLLTGPKWKKWLSSLPHSNWICYGLLIIAIWITIRSRHQRLFSLSRPIYFWLLLPCLGLMACYEATEGDSEMYMEELGGFHKMFVAFVGYGFLLLVFSIILTRSFCVPVLVGSFLFMFLLWQNSSTGRILNLVFILQMTLLLAPQLELTECVLSFVCLS